MSIWQEDTQTTKMIKKVQDYVTFGKINDEILKEVILKKAVAVDAKEKIDGKKVVEEMKKGKTMNQLGIFNCFRMSPPRKGFERKGVKVPYKLGGASGDRKEEINDLITRML